MKTEIKIRFTLEADLKDLPWLYNQSYYGDTNIKTNYEGMLKKFKQLLDNKDYRFISAMQGDKVIGFCSVIINHNIFEQQKPMLMLWNLRVHPDYRKHGVGRSIISFIESFAKSINADFIFLGCDRNNKSARKFYKNLGYDECYGYVKGFDNK